jgi:hypothetical protein
MKRKLIIIIPAVAILLIAAVYLFLTYGTEAAPVQRWIASQLGAVTNQYLNPRLSFGTLRYHYPLTATVDNVRLVADDPAKKGGTVDIFVAKSLTLEMAEIPRPGHPLRIQKLTLKRPEFRAVSVSPQDSRLVGYSNFLKGPASAQPSAQPEAKLSDVFEIRQIEVAEGLIVYDPRTPGVKPMKIDQVNFRLNVEPVKSGETGWYVAEMNLERKPVFSTHFAGRMNLDMMVLEAQSLQLSLTLGRNQDHYLPPQLQTLLKEHEVSGNLVVEASGSMPVSDWRAANLKAHLTLAGGNLAVGEHRLPLEHLDVRWTMADRRGKLETLDAGLLGGRLAVSGEVVLNGPLDGHFDVRLSDLQLQQCLRNAAGGEGKYKGNLSGDFSWRGPLTEPRKQSQGSGNLRVVNGDLVHVPVLEDILGVVTRTMKTVGVGSGPPRDTADVAFTFEGDRVNLGTIHAVTRLAALHGHGNIYFDTRFDLLINAGPVEKIESLLGQVGALLGKVSDQVSAYTVTGTLGQPRVGVAVAPNF